MSLQHRLQTKIKITKDNHWIWTGLRSAGGYGRIKYNGKFYQAHRISMYLYKNFDLNSKEHILHKPECNIYACINPEHLYAGSHKDNMQDRIIAGNDPNLNKTHCSQGHEYNSKNTYRNPSSGFRQCKTCHREREMLRRDKKRLQKYLTKEKE